jgi:hypothetical protein
MSKKQHISLWVVLLLAGIAWFFRPYEKPDLEQVEPRLLALSEPYQSVELGYFMDGGSIGIHIKDANGKVELFALPQKMGGPAGYPEVFVGAIHVNDAGATPVANSSETKKALLVLLDRYRNGDPDQDEIIHCLSGRTSDFVRILVGQQKARWHSP